MWAATSCTGKPWRSRVLIYLATRADANVEFLASTDNWFRPVNFANTPDGTLLILDMYRETIEHPWSIPEPIKQHLDLTSGKDRGRLYTLVFDGTTHRLIAVPGWAAPRPRSSLRCSPTADAWWRETAQRLLIERRDASAVLLLEDLAARRPTALGRLHALWTLDVLAALPDSLLTMGLRDPEPRVREQAGPPGGKQDSPMIQNCSPQSCRWPATPIRWSGSRSH